MWFIRKSNEEYLSVRNFPTVTFVSSHDRDMTEIFKIQKTNDGLIICSCTNPSVYIGEHSCLTTDPFKVHTYSNLSDVYCGCYQEEIYINNISITKCVQDIDENGYTILPCMFDVETIEKVKCNLDIVNGTERNRRQLRHGDLIRRDPNVHLQLLTIPPVRMLLRCYMKDNLKLATWSSNTLFKTENHNNNDLSWHVDYPYHDIEPPWLQSALGSPLGIQTLYTLDDFTTENGGTWIIPKSHMNQTFPTNVNTCLHTAQQLVCKKGSVVVSHGAWWHSQGFNYTNEPRTCLLGTYCKKWIKNKDDMVGQLAGLSYDSVYNEILDTTGLT